MEVVKVTVTNNVSANNVEYNVNNLNELINELNKIDKLFCLMYGDAKVFHSLIDIIHDHELKDNYTIVYLDYDKDLIFKIKEMKDNNKDITNENNLKTIVFGGGVSANSYLKTRMKNVSKINNWKVYIPKLEYSTDNAAMIGIVGHLKYKDSIKSSLTSTPSPRLTF